MTRRILAILLSLCLLVPAMGLTAAQTVSAADNGYVIADIPLKISGMQTVVTLATTSGQLFVKNASFDAIDLTKYGYPATGTIAPGKLGISMDLYLGGDNGLAAMVARGEYRGQFEITSSGKYDVEELNCNPNLLKWKQNAWNRCVVDLSKFSVATGGAFNPQNFNYLRLYMMGFAAFEGQQCSITVCNVRLVDLTKTAPGVEEDPIGDGSFTPAPPVWQKIDIADGYADDEPVIAGYNLKEYVAAHGITNIRDYSPVIQSLVNGLQMAGGGALFIPAGHYPCYNSISVPHGVSIYGEWVDPTEHPEVTGTVLEVYGDSGSFLTLAGNSLAKNLAFWYPEQGATASNIKAYPATIDCGGSSSHVVNVTLVNSYLGLYHNSGGGLPNATNVYGTPLFVGIDMDMVTDIMRLENLHFAADYWINSGLPGAPVGTEEQAALREYLRYNATGFILRRIDWSYLTWSSVKGYNTGLIFAQSTSTSYPNGQSHHLLFEDCNVGLYVSGVAPDGEMVTDSEFRGCGTGVWVSNESGNATGVLQLIRDTFECTGKAVNQVGSVNTALLSCTVKSGGVSMGGGWLSAADSVFYNEAPQIELENGAAGAVILNCKDGSGKNITLSNPYLCPLTVDTEASDIGEIPAVTAEQVMPQVKKPASDDVYLATDLDSTGKNDVTAALQAWLDKAAKTGGTVYLPGGNYRLNGSVTVPSGVELRGCCDYGRIPYRTGTILAVYGGEDDPDADPTVILEANSGIRGIVFDYPNQYQQKKWVTYPYGIQGRGENVYIINTTFRDGWNGADLMTYKCENHYVDFLGGICLNNALSVGHGVENGILRNCHFNYNALANAGAANWGGWASVPVPQADFIPLMQEQLNHHAVMIRVGDVKNEIIYDCFNYSGYNGLLFEAEETGGARAVVYGHSCDYTTVAIDLQSAEKVNFVNTQLTSFNQIADKLTARMHYIRLGENFKGETTVTGLALWADPDEAFSVQGGRLNVYGLNWRAYSDKVELADVGKNGQFNVRVGLFKHSAAVKALTTESAGENLTVNGGYCFGSVVDTDRLGRFDHVLTRRIRWDVPENAQFTQNNMLFTEAFTEYSSVQSGARDFQFLSDGESSIVQPKNDMLELTLKNAASSVGVYNKKAHLACGTAEDFYHLETRVRVKTLRECAFSRMVLQLFSNDGDVVNCAIVTKDGLFAQNGDEEIKVADFATDEWYRLAIEVDNTDPVAKTYTVILYDDKYTELGRSEAILFAEGMQDARVDFNTVWLGLLSDRDAGDSVGAMSVDYLFVTYGAAGTLGDVNGDDKIDSTDARLILQYYAKKIGEDDLNTAVADVNGDDKVDSTDARLILQLYAKKISEFPVA